VKRQLQEDEDKKKRKTREAELSRQGSTAAIVASPRTDDPFAGKSPLVQAPGAPKKAAPAAQKPLAPMAPAVKKPITGKKAQVGDELDAD
jgi:hypothetical protein